MFWESQLPGALRVCPGIALPLPYTLPTHFLCANLCMSEKLEEQYHWEDLGVMRE